MVVVPPSAVVTDPGAGAPVINWTCTRFEGLALQDLYDALQLRARVFILEQGPFLDPDGVDAQCSHLLGRLASPHAGLPAGELVLYLRLVDPGVKYAEPSIGRVVSHAALRGQGQGRVLVGEGVRHCGLVHPGQAIRISAQAHLAGFYGEVGFACVGTPYIEDTIPHVEMLRPAEGASADPRTHTGAAST